MLRRERLNDARERIPSEIRWPLFLTRERPLLSPRDFSMSNSPTVAGKPKYRRIVLNSVARL